MANGKNHDQNFKNLILDYPREALAFFAPSEAPARNDDVEILPVRQEQLKERLGDRFRELDVPLMVKWQDGRREAVLFLLEEETEYRRFSLHRLAHYCLDLAELCKTDRIVPVVIFLHASSAISLELVLGTERNDYLKFFCLACNLPSLAFDDWQNSDNLVARVNLVNMRLLPSQRVPAYAEAIRGLLELEPEPDKRTKYLEFIDIYAALTDNERQRWQEEFPEEVTTMTGYFERARQEGRQEGRLEGRHEGKEEGRQEALRSLLNRHLQHKFGTVPESVQQQLEMATVEQLEIWAERLLDADRLETVFT